MIIQFTYEKGGLHMAWCPKCKNEYIEGITHCNDCDVDLVDELQKEDSYDFDYFVADPEILEDLVNYLHEVSIDSATIVHNDEQDVDLIGVDHKQSSDARMHIAIYVKNLNLDAQLNTEDEPTMDSDYAPSEIEGDFDNDTMDIEGNMESASIINQITSQNVYKHTESYIKLSDKYEDVKSSSYTLLFVGIIGAIALIGELAGLYTFPIASSTKWLFYGVMSLIFGGFIIYGIYSFISAKKLKVQADAEEELINNIMDWSNENFTNSNIDANIDTDIQEELLYFNRVEYIKNKLMMEFENVDEGLIDLLIESIYTKLYESNDDLVTSEEFEDESHLDEDIDDIQ